MSADTTDPRVARTRADVHQAVVHLLQTEGVAGVTHQRVAEVAGVARATVYRHWEDRAALLADTLRALRPNPQGVELTGDVREDMLRLVTEGARQIERRPYLPWLIALLAAEDVDPELQGVLADVSRMQGTPMAPLLAHAVEEGLVPSDVQPEVAAASIVGPLFALRFIFGLELTEERVAAVVDAWWDGHAT